MAEKVYEVITVGVVMECDECHKGLMQPMDVRPKITYKSPGEIDTIEFHHKCNNCGVEKLYPNKYPYSKLIPKDPYTPLKDLSEYEK